MSFGMTGIQFEGKRVLGIYVERNILTDYQRGIQLGDVSTAAIIAGSGKPVDVSETVDGCRIATNVVARRAGVPAKLGFTPEAFAIATHVARCEIVENAMNIETLEQHGILVAGGNTLVHRNEVRSNATFDLNNPLKRIPFGVVAIETLSDALLCSIRGNLFKGLQQAVLASGTGSGGSHRVDIIDNRIEGVERLVTAAREGRLTLGGGSPIAQLIPMLERFSAIFIADLSHCRIADNEITMAVCGVAGATTLGTSVVANRVSFSLSGVILLGSVECEVVDNVIDASLKGAPTIGVGLFSSTAAWPRATPSAAAPKASSVRSVRPCACRTTISTRRSRASARFSTSTSSSVATTSRTRR